MRLHVECLKYILLCDDFTIHYRGWPRQAKERKFPKKVVCRPEKQCVEKENGPQGEKKS